METPSYNIEWANKVSVDEFVKNQQGTGFTDDELKAHWQDLQVKPDKKAEPKK